MARPSLELVAALRRTADRLASGAQYRWSDFGMCNCGHLAQTVTACPPGEIQAAAFSRPGDWAQKAREYCGATGLPLDGILDGMLALGLTPTDIAHLERLADPAVLESLGTRSLRHYDRGDAVRYLRAWADLLARRLPTPAARPVRARAA